MKTLKRVETAGGCVRMFRILTAFCCVFAVLAVTELSAEETVSAEVEESDAKMDSLLDPVMAKAVALFKQKKFEEALKECDRAENIFKTEKYLSSPHTTAQKSMVAQLRSDINSFYAKRLMEPVHAKYKAAEAMLEKNPERAFALLKEVEKNAAENVKKMPSLKGEAALLAEASGKLLKGGPLAMKSYAGNEHERRENVLKTAVDPVLQEAETLLEQKQFKKAWQKTVEASEKIAALSLGSVPAVLVKKSEIVALRADISQQWERTYIIACRKAYLSAVDDISGKRRESASVQANTALNLAREGRAELPYASAELQEIEKAAEQLVKSEGFFQAIASEVDEGSIKERRDAIKALLIKGEAFYRNKKYSQARDVLEQVYTQDPFNEKANVLLAKIYRKLDDTAWMRRENEMLERMNEIDWKWNGPSRWIPDQVDDSQALASSGMSETAKIYAKLQTIIIPLAEYNGADISQVLLDIRDQAQKNDPEMTGIDIVYPVLNSKDVDMTLSNVPLGELIRYVCMYAGLKYRVDETGVRIGEANVDDMERRYFKMTSALHDQIVKGSAGTDEKTASKDDDKRKVNLMSDDEMENPFEDMKDEKDSEKYEAEDLGDTSAKLREFFISCGIPFEEGSAVSYDQNSGKLTVLNTPENLKLMDALLREIDILTPMVLVEAKIIEIVVSDLEELGFDWTLTRNNQDASFITGNANSTSDFGSSATYELANTAINQTLTRHVGGTSDSSVIGSTSVDQAINMISDMNIIPNFGPDGAYNVFLTVHAVDQSSRGEILSAPKVIAASGTEATVTMAQEMYFPESWNDPEVTSSNNTYEYTPPYPDFGDPVPIGVVFKVLPTVSPNKKTITLKLCPEVSSLSGWSDYDYQIIVGGISSVDANSTEYKPKMKMPKIAKRKLNTQLKIFDGETVVLGGVLFDTEERLDDKYPFLGEVPLVGNLFSSKGHRGNKTNMLIFVTPRKLGLDGAPVREMTDNGMFDFIR